MRTFPIFVSFDGTPPLVVGGGQLAAIKARLLLKRRRSVDVAADLLDLSFGARRRGQGGSLAPMPGIDQMRGRPLVISATEDEEEDARVAENRACAWRSGQRAGPARAMHLLRCRRSSIAARSPSPSAPRRRPRFWPSACAPGWSMNCIPGSMILRSSPASSAIVSPRALPAGPRAPPIFWETIFDGAAPRRNAAG